MRRLRFLAAALFVVEACALLVLLDCADFADFVPAALGAGLWVAEVVVLSDCLPKARGETQRDPQAIPATMHKTNVREDKTLTLSPEIGTHH